MSSWRAIGSVIGRAVRGLTERVFNVWTVFAPKVVSVPKFAGKLTRTAVTNVRLPARARPISLFGRVFVRTMNTGGQTAVRAASLALWHQRNAGTQSQGLVKKQQWSRHNLLSDIRNLLHRVVVGDASTSQLDLSELDASRLPHDINAYDINDYICHGCNGAVYSAKLKPTTITSQYSFLQFHLLQSGISTDSMMPRLAKLLPSQQPVGSTADLHSSPLVIKLLFNYNYFASINQIWWDNENEVVPVMDKRLHGRFRECKPLLKTTSKHNNIVKLYTAFIDQMPILPRAQELFPAALPPDLALTGQQPLKTMFLVLKRYNLTLREYLLSRQPSTIASHVMFAQLLEACAFLRANKVAHRDLKSDNILLECDADDADAPPMLVVSDFGSCLASGSMEQSYYSEHCDLGGNVCLRAPEIRTARPSDKTKLDYAAADLWACGTLAYEMFSRLNPFYSMLHSDEYAKQDLPSMPSHTPPVLQRLVSHILNVDPSQRPPISLASSVAVLSLMRLSDQLSTLLYSIRTAVKQDQSEKLMNDFLSLFAVETLLGSRHSSLISRAEAQLRYSWMQRVDYLHLKPALQLMYTYNASTYAEQH